MISPQQVWTEAACGDSNHAALLNFPHGLRLFAADHFATGSFGEPGRASIPTNARIAVRSHLDSAPHLCQKDGARLARSLGCRVIRNCSETNVHDTFAAGIF